MCGFFCDRSEENKKNEGIIQCGPFCYIDSTINSLSSHQSMRELIKPIELEEKERNKWIEWRISQLSEEANEDLKWIIEKEEKIVRNVDVINKIK